MAASLRYVLLLQRDVHAAARFYNQGLGLPIRVLTDSWAELEAGAATLALKAADGGATAGAERAGGGAASQLLSFRVPDLQGALTRMLQLGGEMDGAVQYLPHGGKVRRWLECLVWCVVASAR
jgi:predicted enzyme related to lactoylglutathione lyase